MQKILAILAAALLLGACSAKPDQTKESADTETEVVVDEASLEALKTLETTVDEIATDAEELAKEVDELIENL